VYWKEHTGLEFKQFVEIVYDSFNLKWDDALWLDGYRMNPPDTSVRDEVVREVLEILNRKLESLGASKLENDRTLGLIIENGAQEDDVRSFMFEYEIKFIPKYDYYLGGFYTQKSGQTRWVGVGEMKVSFGKDSYYDGQVCDGRMHGKGEYQWPIEKPGGLL
jgi:hypothetical protein